MEIHTQAKIYKKEKKDPLKVSFIFLLIIIFITLGLYFYNKSIEKEIGDLKSNISKKTASISNLELDSKILVSRLYEANKSSIKKIEDYSKIPVYINHLYKTQKKYGIKFKGFKYESGKVQTQVIASSNSMVNYMKVYNFITKYRNNIDDQSLFNLELIKSIKTTDDKVSNIFNINLNLKNNIDLYLTKIEEIERKKKEKQDELKAQNDALIKEKIRKLREKKEDEKEIKQ